MVSLHSFHARLILRFGDMIDFTIGLRLRHIGFVELVGRSFAFQAFAQIEHRGQLTLRPNKKLLRAELNPNLILDARDELHYQQ